MIIERERIEKALPSYEIGERLGSGRFGLVVAGRHRQLGRAVAIKVVERDASEDEVADFAAEARILAGLSHPHVVQVFEYAEADGLSLVVMELLEGGTLAGLRDGLDPRQSCAVGLAVASALGYAHSQGVLHRDVKGDNIMFARDRTVKVTDFGIAKLYEGVDATASTIAGTPVYMAPEQITKGKLGPATDLYALGVVLYRLLTGGPPFSARQPVHELWDQHLNAPPPPMDGVPDPIERVVLRTLAKEPDDRYPSVNAFTADFLQATTEVWGTGWARATDLPLHLPADSLRVYETDPDMPPRETRRPRGRSSRRRPLVAAGAAVALVAALAATLLTVGAGRGRSAPDHPPATRAPDAAQAARSLAARVYPTQAHDPVAALRLAVTAYRLAATPETRAALLAVSGAGATSSSVTDPDDDLSGVAFSPDGRTVAVVAVHHHLRLYTLRAAGVPAALATVAPSNPADRWVVNVAFSPNGQVLAAPGSGNTAELWDVRDPSHPRPLARLVGHTKQVVAVAFSPDGRTLATGGADDTARLWDVSDPGRPRPLPQVLAHPEIVHGVAFSPDGRTLATACWDGEVRLWNVARPGPPAILTGSPGAVQAVAFSPDGHTLASVSATSGDQRERARLWNVADPTHPWSEAVLTGADSTSTFGVAFSPDGRTLATASWDGTVGLWDVSHPEDWRLLTTLTGYGSEVSGVAFSRDGRILATASSDGTLRLWNLDPARLAQQACTDAGQLSPDEWRRDLPTFRYREVCR